MNSLIALINKKSLKKSIPDVKTGDIVRVSQRITEGSKSRVQVFEGIVISREGGNGVTASITVRKIASGVGVEKKFLLNSPNIEGVKVLRSSKVRRKKIFFLRGLTGKAAKMKERQRKVMEEIGLKSEEEVETAETTEDLAPAPIEENEEIKEKTEEPKEDVKIEEETVSEEKVNEKEPEQNPEEKAEAEEAQTENNEEAETEAKEEGEKKENEESKE